MALLLAGQRDQAMEAALRWRAQSPGDVLALVALGEAAEALGDVPLAARAYGSIIDLFPARADLRRFAGERLARLGVPEALALCIDTFTRAVESRPDHPSGHRLLAMALLRAGRLAEAFEAIARGQARSYPPRFPGVDRILAEDLGLCAAALLRAEPHRRDEILGRLQRAGAGIEDAPSVRFVLVWETDANDVDFHIRDAGGGHAYYAHKALRSGGELYADVTQGYGPECFTIRGDPRARAYPYRLEAHYFRRGPMGYGMGSLQIVEHDGQGGFVFEERPYVVMHDRAFVDLGVVTGPLLGYQKR
jgi:tetratricopeptide (TPR) repeat protein